MAIKAADVTAPPVRAAIADLKRRALASGQMNAPIVVDTNADAHRRHRRHPARRQRRRQHLEGGAPRPSRSDLLPATLGRVDGVDYAVTGIDGR